MTVTTGEDRAEAPSPLRIEELLRPEAFGHPVSGLKLVETHISWVVLTGALAYKIKKPVKLDFIDTSTLERRLYYCHEELRLNRRLAPQLYLKVVPITRQNGTREAGRVRVEGELGPAIEYAVCLKQFDAKDELPAILARGDVSVTEINALAESIAKFHQQSPASSREDLPDKTERMYDSVLGNLDQLLAHMEPLKPLTGVERLVAWTQETIAALEPTFEARERAGFIREGHGDLHSANIVRFQHRLVPFDCIDFDPHLRWIDVMNDLAFLVMDLVSREREDLSTALLSKYLEITGDYAGVRLLPFYAVYRALVRAKVDAITAEQSPTHAAEFRRRLHRRVSTAVRWMERPRPVLILMHGVSGSGKSWLSERLVATLPALRIRSDLERKRLVGRTAGSSEGASFKQGLYAPEISHRTYARLIECAESCLQAGFTVIVDAGFLDPADRELFHGLAKQLQITRMIISCQADRDTLLSRVEERAKKGKDPSDADRKIVEAQLRDIKPLSADERPELITVDTRRSDVVRQVVAAVHAVAARK